jgi:hypothetical protein
VVSGTAITLYEFEVFNVDYIVDFGVDGTLYAEYLGNTPVGEEGAPQAVAIYNNSTDVMPADAYAVIDYTGTAADEYVRISATENGTYYGINDGVLIDDDQSSSEYRWSMSPSVVGRSLVAGDTVRNFGRLVQLPTVSKAEFTYGAEHCWDYDEVNNKIYVAASDGIIKLYNLATKDGAWTYLSEINPGAASHQYNVSIAYMNGRIYAVTNATLTPAFGYYTLSGSLNNWTSQSSPVASGTAVNLFRYNICSDYSRYIYLISARNDGAVNNYFARFDTVSGTWSALSNTYDYTTGLNNYTFHIWFDRTRNVIYATTGTSTASDNASSRYLQRYFIPTNTWNTTFLDTTSFRSGNRSTWAFAYCNDVIYMMFPASTDTLYKYNLNTGSVTSETINFSLFSYPYSGNNADSAICYMMAIKPPTMSSGIGGELLVGQVAVDRTYVYQYKAVGIYTSPVFLIADPNNSSYFLTGGAAASGTGSISYDEESYNGTIRVRSSNTAPIVINEVFTVQTGLGNNPYLNRWQVYPNTITNNFMFVFGDDLSNPPLNRGIAFIDRRTGYFAVSDLHSNANGRVHVLNKTGTLQWSVSEGFTSDYKYYFNVNCGFDNVVGLWGYGNSNSTAYRLYHLNYLGSQLALIYDGTDFLYDLAVEWDGDGVWYTDKISNLVRHRDSVGVSLQSISLPQPRSICSTTDDGCWVVDNTNLAAYRYTSSGVLSSTVNLGMTSARMTHDYYDGFWYINGNMVYHVTSVGATNISVAFTGVTRVVSAINGCMAYNSSTGSAKFIDSSTGTVTRTWATVLNTTIGVLSADMGSFSYNPGVVTNVFPASYDPVWGTGGSLAWQGVRKDGYFLPKAKYHQVEVTLRGDAALTKLLMPPAVKVENIQPQNYKNVYVKTDIPIDASITSYEARLKVWWGVNA